MIFNEQAAKLKRLPMLLGRNNANPVECSKVVLHGKTVAVRLVDKPLPGFTLRRRVQNLPDRDTCRLEAGDAHRIRCSVQSVRAGKKSRGRNRIDPTAVDAPMKSETLLAQLLVRLVKPTTEIGAACRNDHGTGAIDNCNSTAEKSTDPVQNQRQWTCVIQQIQTIDMPIHIRPPNNNLRPIILPCIVHRSTTGDCSGKNVLPPFSLTRIISQSANRRKENNHSKTPDTLSDLSPSPLPGEVK